jgi:probable FeS assembly SUF system protein SufT
MTERGDIIILNRDCTALMVPSGARIMLHEGTEVTVTQALGDSFTVNIYGNLARIDTKDADALGKEVKQPLEDLPEGASLEDKVWAQLKTVFDPEIPVNIVDLGLVYKVKIEPQDNAHVVYITMTLTAAGCGMGPVIAADARDKVGIIEEISEVDVELVFDPPWDQSMMSEAAQLELGIL